MHALSMIDMGTQTAGAVASAKTPNKNEQQFGKVLNEKQQQHESKSVDRQPETVEGSSDNQVIAHNHKTETKQEATGQKELSNEIVAEKSIQTNDEVNPQQQVKVQHIIVDLMKTIVKG